MLGARLNSLAHGPSGLPPCARRSGAAAGAAAPQRGHVPGFLLGSRPAGALPAFVVHVGSGRKVSVTVNLQYKHQLKDRHAMVFLTSTLLCWENPASQVSFLHCLVNLWAARRTWWSWSMRRAARSAPSWRRTAWAASRGALAGARPRCDVPQHATPQAKTPDSSHASNSSAVLLSPLFSPSRAALAGARLSCDVLHHV